MSKDDLPACEWAGNYISVMLQYCFNLCTIKVFEQFTGTKKVVHWMTVCRLSLARIARRSTRLI
ncbi:hypothetical protein [Acinetobacter sp. CFCC 10889]|uniref:hypothetical protein n=1 Tax=Acinetobacter sp. CFCC 10889 TaxID=1775557 RepID=UPI0013A69B55|nr:hypothetical protein [Acinetobacter sp. CFCC 10889]